MAPVLSKDPNDDWRHWLRQDRFKIYSSRELMEGPERVRNAVGAYVILLRDAVGLLERVGLPETKQIACWTLGDHQHVYTGVSAAIRSRVLLHVCGTIHDSAVRETLLSLQFSHQILWPDLDVAISKWEERLTDWLVDNSYVAFRIDDRPSKIESQLIDRLPSPFNTEGNERSPFLPLLDEKRAQFRAFVKATGHKRPAQYLTPSQRLVGAAETHWAGWQSRHST